jgi:hypothetical protein
LYIPCFLNIPHLFTSNRTVRIPLMHHNGAGDYLKHSEVIQDKALTVSVFVLSELVTCSIYILTSLRCVTERYLMSWHR